MSRHSQIRIGAVILAAGNSSRFGRPKQLVQFRGKTLVRRIVDAANEAGCSTVIVVVGDNHDDIKRELISTEALIIKNNNWQRGVGSSIRAGVEALTKLTGSNPRAPVVRGVVLLLCDQPFVKAATIKQLIALKRKEKKPIVASTYARTLGVPALFDSSCFHELLALNDAFGAKPIILRDRSRVAGLPFPQGEIDIDNLNDYEDFAQRSS